MDIIVNNISYHYPKSNSNVLTKVSFSVKSGMVTGLIGANGAGKSTLIKSMLGILKHEGEVIIGEKNVQQLSRENLMKDVGYLIQENSFLSSLTVFETVLLGRIHNLKFKADDKHIEKVWGILEMLGITDLAEKKFYALSGGQRRVVGLAQIFVKEPKVIILDEPTANLDIQNELEILELIRAYAVKMNVATLVILHEINMASRFCDNLILLNKGCVYKSGKPISVITKESIKEAYGVNVNIHINEEGLPMIYLVNSIRQKNYNFEREDTNGFAIKN